MAALATTMMAGAVGYGLDTYRLENARNELDHVVDLTCDCVEHADMSLCFSTDSRMDMAKTFATSQVPESALDPGRTSFKVSQNGDKITYGKSPRILKIEASKNFAPETLKWVLNGVTAVIMARSS